LARVAWTPGASLELVDILGSLSQTSATFAQAFLEELDAGVARLATFPRSGRMVPEFYDDAFRDVIVAPYRILYRIRQDDVEIIGLVHGRRDFGSYLADR